MNPSLNEESKQVKVSSMRGTFPEEFRCMGRRTVAHGGRRSRLSLFCFV